MNAAIEVHQISNIEAKANGTEKALHSYPRIKRAIYSGAPKILNCAHKTRKAARLIAESRVDEAAFYRSEQLHATSSVNLRTKEPIEQMELRTSD